MPVAINLWQCSFCPCVMLYIYLSPLVPRSSRGKALTFPVFVSPTLLPAFFGFLFSGSSFLSFFSKQQLEHTSSDRIRNNARSRPYWLGVKRSWPGLSEFPQFLRYTIEESQEITVLSHTFCASALPSGMCSPCPAYVLGLVS